MKKHPKPTPTPLTLAARIAATLQNNGYKYYACDIPHDGKCSNCLACMEALIDRELKLESKRTPK